MVSKCANPRCGNSFRYLREGKLFLVEPPFVVPATGVQSAESEWGRRVGHAEYFWLCRECAKSMSISCDQKGHAVLVFPDRRQTVDA